MRAPSTRTMLSMSNDPSRTTTTSETPQTPGAGTRYDEPVASDGRGGPHPLAGIPQDVLDAATGELRAAGPVDRGCLVIEADDIEPVAHAVLLAALVALRSHEAGTGSVVTSSVVTG